MAESSIKRWLTDTQKEQGRCRTAQRLLIKMADQAKNLSDYYQGIPTPGYFVNGLFIRQPELCFSALEVLLTEFSLGEESELVSVVVSSGTPDSSLLDVVQRKINLPNVRGRRNLFMALDLFLKLRLGANKKPAMAALGVAERMVMYSKSRGNQTAREDGMKLLRGLVPFETWEKGLDNL